MKAKNNNKKSPNNYKKVENEKNIKIISHQNTNIISKKLVNEQKKICNRDKKSKCKLRKSDNNLCLLQNIKSTNYANKITKTKIQLEKSTKNDQDIKSTLTINKTVKKALSREKDTSSYYSETFKKYNHNNLNNAKVDNEILYMPQYTKIDFEEKIDNRHNEYKTERKVHTNKILSSNNIRKSIKKIKKDRIIDISDSEDNSVIINNEEETEDSNQVISTSFPKLSSNPFFTLNNEKKKINKNNENKKNLFFSPSLIRKKGRCIQKAQLYYNNKNINNNNNNKNSPSITKTVLSINSSTTQNSNDTINNINIYNLDNNKRKKINDLNSNINMEGEIDNEKIINNQNNKVINADDNNVLFKNLFNSIKNEENDKIIEIIKKIKEIQKNAFNINIQDKENGNTALHYACQKNNKKIIQYLLDSNSDPNIKNNNMQTPLHIAAKEGYIDICKVLIDNGALLNIYDSNKKTPIHYACENNFSELIKYFYDIFIEMDIDEKICDNLKNNKEINSLFKKYFQKEEKKTKNSNHLNHFSSKTNLLKDNKENLYYLVNNKANKSSDKIIKSKAKKSRIINIENKKGNYHKNNNNADTYSNLSLNTGNSGTNEIETKLITNYEKYNNNNFNKVCNIGNKLIKEGYHKNKKTINNPFTKENKNTSLSKNKENDYYEVNKTYDENSKFNGRKKNNHKINNNKIIKNNCGNIIKRKESNIKKVYDSSQPKFNTSSKNIKFNMKSLKQLEALTEQKNNYNTINKNYNSKFSHKNTIEKKNLNEYYDKSISKNNMSKKIGQLNQTMDSNINMDITSINALNKMSLSLNLIKEEEEKINTKNFICLALLGRGSFGEVYLVQKINTKKKYAMKILRKERIIGQNLSKYAIAERNVLSVSNHPFIVKLNYAFQSLTKLFLILEYCPGGDLAKHLSIEKKFEENRAKFYLCEILLALEYLHKKNIIFRDLKPENIVLDEEGHCKLTDFGLSKEGIDNDNYTKSFCGSIAYLAPEVLKKQGHGKAVDWYLLGVLLYEMLTGVTPYYDRNRNVLFYNIEQGKLVIPNFVSENARSLLIGLLQKDPKKRLGGNSRDAEEIKEHKFFEDIDWQKIYEKKYEPPKAIKINHNMYIFNKPKYFADENNLEEIFGNNSLKGWTFINNNEM